MTTIQLSLCTAARPTVAATRLLLLLVVAHEADAHETRAGHHTSQVKSSNHNTTRVGFRSTQSIRARRLQRASLSTACP